MFVVAIMYLVRTYVYRLLSLYAKLQHFVWSALIFVANIRAKSKSCIKQGQPTKNKMPVLLGDQQLGKHKRCSRGRKQLNESRTNPINKWPKCVNI